MLRYYSESEQKTFAAFFLLLLSCKLCWEEKKVRWSMHWKQTVLEKLVKAGSMWCDGKAEASGMKGPGFKSLTKARKIYFSCFGFVAFDPWDPPLSICRIASNTLWYLKSRYPHTLRCVEVPVTFHETGDLATYKLQLLLSQISMVHISMREDPNMKINLKVWRCMCQCDLYCVPE